MREFTKEQQAAIDARGRTIVSASAGSGKTSVMIEKLVQAVLRGVDLDDILAVTFTNKAAAQMKERLRSGLIERLETADGEERSNIKLQLSKISTSNISTIHSFCAKTLRTYFYLADIDSGFDIISADDNKAAELKNRALETLFERKYAEGDEQFKLLLNCFVRKRSDKHLKQLLCEAHSKVRGVADYDKLLGGAESLYTEQGFKKVCGEYKDICNESYRALYNWVTGFEESFEIENGLEKYWKIFDEMKTSILVCQDMDLFEEKPALCKVSRPAAKSDEEKLAAARFSEFRTALNKAYNDVKADLLSEDEEREAFFQSGKIVQAFCSLLLEFDKEYTAVKRDENKLDYNDLEHLTLKLLTDENSAAAGRFKYVFVDEYQDVNPVQERIISAVTADSESFSVGDIKQAIYGFRGSKSKFFDEKFKRYSYDGGNALRLTDNFRSSPAVIDFVNDVFGEVMSERVCGFDYNDGSRMNAKGSYPKGYGAAEIHIFGKEETEVKERGIYSVQADKNEGKYTREGLAVVDLVRKKLAGERYDTRSGGFVPVQACDICILTRKRQDSSALGIAKALTDAGYSVSGAREANICSRPEVRNMLDILSYLDDEMQDIPLVTTMLSPIGGFTEDELSEIRYTAKFEKGESDTSFRRCCELCAERGGELSAKLADFRKEVERLRDMCEILSAGEVIDKILCETGYEAAYCSGGGDKLKNVLRLAEEGENLSVSAFLRKIKAGGYNIAAPASAQTDSIKIMTMHSAKGLEFPIVIIADICKSFEGRDIREMPFDEEYIFAPKNYDFKNSLVSDTILRKLCKARQDKEELVNEVYLFYVACTRAECELHIMASEVKPYSESQVTNAKSYAKLFDISKRSPQFITELTPIKPKGKAQPAIYKPDAALVEEIKSRYACPYDFAKSVDLPVKSSASAILRAQSEEEEYFVPHNLFVEENTGAERGTAYHRFLQLCDFSQISRGEIAEELKLFAERGDIAEEQAELLEVEKLFSILNMPVFKNIRGATLFKEQEFLCHIPADEIFDTDAKDKLLVQGAIDLLGVGEKGVFIIDYKYSSGSDEYLKNHYAKQLDLYKKAVSQILKVREETISATIINICLCRQIDMD